MEPAGSMGVWNLDDYQFVAFIWGAAQLGEKARIKPKSIPDPEIAEMLAKENQFFACLSYIHKVKSGPFPEHSNQLWNISAVPNWGKVFTGLIKMYRAEVLCKFPVIQHSLFGSLLSLAPAKSTNPLIPAPDAGQGRPGPPVLGVDSPRPSKFSPRTQGVPLADNLHGIPAGMMPSMHPGISGVIPSGIAAMGSVGTQQLNPSNHQNPTKEIISPSET